MAFSGKGKQHSADTTRDLFSALDRNGEPLLPYYGRDLWVLALLALVLRVAYLWLGAHAQSVTEVSMWAYDTKTYLSVAQYWLTGDVVGEQNLLLAGPGYGVLLAVSQFVFGVTPWPPLLLSLVLGCVAPIVVYLTAMVLVGRRSVALLAGAIVCVSTTGISLSVSLLTDQPFYTLHALALLWFALGLKTDRTGWYVLAGTTAAVATLIRAMGQVWPVVFVGMAILFVFMHHRRHRWPRLRRALWAPALLLLVILGWSTHNYARFGVFAFTSNAAHAAWLYLSSQVEAMQTPGLDTKTARAEHQAQMDSVARHSPNPARDLYYWSRQRASGVAAQHPFLMARAFQLTVWDNVKATNDHLYPQLPQFKSLWDAYNRQARDWINSWIFWISVAGLVMLFVDRKQLAWIITAPTFILFTLLTGFSFWQGSRLHYPAEMAWSILFAYAAVRLADWLGPKILRYRRRHYSPAP